MAFWVPNFRRHSYSSLGQSHIMLPKSLSSVDCTIRSATKGVKRTHMGSCQNHGPLLGPSCNAARVRLPASFWSVRTIWYCSFIRNMTFFHKLRVLFVGVLQKPYYLGSMFGSLIQSPIWVVVKIMVLFWVP